MNKNATPFSDMTVLPAEGARVGIVTCLLCGAALLIDPRDKTPTTLRHTIWHESLKMTDEE